MMNLDMLGVIPVLVGPLQILLTFLPAILAAVGATLLRMLSPKAWAALLQLMWHKKIATLCVLAGIAGIVYLAMQDFSGKTKADTRVVAGKDWTAFRGGPERRGTGGGEEPASGGLNWAWKTKDFSLFLSSPAVVGNRIYAATASLGIMFEKGGILCLDDKGGEAWHYSPKGFRPTYSSPAVMGKYLVCGEGIHFTRDARITCLDTANGQKLWEFRTGSHVESSPCIYQDRCFIGAGDDGMYCIALEPKDAQANVLWHLKGKVSTNLPTPPGNDQAYPDCETSPVAADGKLYFGLGIDGNAVVCVSTDDGKEIWRQKTPYPVFGSPTLGDGKLFVGMGNGDMVNEAEAVREKEIQKLKKAGAGEAEVKAAWDRLAPGGEVWCLDAAKGDVLWRFKTPQTVLGTVAYAGGNIYFASSDGTTWCVEVKTQKVLAQWNANAKIKTCPVVGEQYVYVVTESGRLYGLDRKKLRPVWDVAVDVPGPGKLFVSSPALANGRIYVGTPGNGLVCMGQPAIKKPRDSWDGYLGGPGAGGNLDSSPVGARGEYSWDWPKPADANAACASYAPPVFLNNAFYTAYSMPDRTGLAKIAEGARGAKPDKDIWFYATPNPVRVSPAFRAGRLYAVDGQKGDKGRRLHCVNAEDGAAIWKYPVADDADGSLLLNHEGVFVLDAPDTVAMVRTEGPQAGHAAWKAGVPGAVGYPMMAEDILFVSSGASGSLMALSPAGGQVLWQTPCQVIAAAAVPTAATGPSTASATASAPSGVAAVTPPAPPAEAGKLLAAAPTTGPIAYGVAPNLTVVVGTDRGVLAVNAVTGAPLWSANVGAVTGPLTGDDNYLAAPGPDGLNILTWNGQLYTRLDKALPGIPPLLLSDAVVYATASGLSRMDYATGQSKTWCSRNDWAESLGAVTAGPLLANSRLYFPTARKGLVCARSR